MKIEEIRKERYIFQVEHIMDENKDLELKNRAFKQIKKENQEYLYQCFELTNFISNYEQSAKEHEGKDREAFWEDRIKERALEYMQKAVLSKYPWIEINNGVKNSYVIIPQYLINIIYNKWTCHYDKDELIKQTRTLF